MTDAVSIFLLIIIAFTATNAQDITCNTGSNGSKDDCTCPSSVFPLSTLCTMRCGADYCEDGKTICRAGSPCRVECDGKAACSNAMTLDGRTATDVTLVCSGEDACKENLKIQCGTGACLLYCNRSKTCESISSNSIVPGEAISFDCIGNTCPKFNVAPFQNPTPKPTAAPITPTTTFSPTNIPSIFPTNVPSLSPSFNPSSPPSILPSFSPTSYPTIIPSSIPSESPTTLPTVNATMEPSQEPTDDPTSEPTNDLLSNTLTPSMGNRNSDHLQIGRPTSSAIGEAGAENTTNSQNTFGEEGGGKASNEFIQILITLICVMSILLLVACFLLHKLERKKEKMKIDRVTTHSLAETAQTTTNAKDDNSEGTNHGCTVDDELYEKGNETLMDGEYEVQAEDNVDLEIDDGNPETEALYAESPITKGMDEQMSPNSLSKFITCGITPVIKPTPKSSEDNNVELYVCPIATFDGIEFKE